MIVPMLCGTAWITKFLYAIGGTACSGTLPRLSGCGAVGSVLPWGGRGRRFKSGHSDQRKPTQFRGFFGIAWVFCVSENQMLGHYEDTIFLKSYKKIQQHTTKKPPTELTVFFYLFLYRRAIYEAKIYTAFWFYSQSCPHPFGISYKFLDLFLSHPPIFLTKL